MQRRAGLQNATLALGTPHLVPTFPRDFCVCPGLKKSRSTFAYAPGAMAQAGRSSLRAWVTAAPPAAAAPSALPFAVGLVLDKARNEWDNEETSPSSVPCFETWRW